MSRNKEGVKAENKKVIYPFINSIIHIVSKRITLLYRKSRGLTGNTRHTNIQPYNLPVTGLKGKTVNYVKTLILLPAMLLVSISCNTNQPKDISGKMELIVEETSSTEAWLKLAAANLTLPVDVALSKDNELHNSFTLESSDTLLYLDGLKPNKTYNFRAGVTGGSVITGKVPVKTMDTTSHNFSWEKKVVSFSAYEPVQ